MRMKSASVIRLQNALHDLQRAGDSLLLLNEFMNKDLTQATWAARSLPAWLNVTQTSKLLGFGEQDIQILMSIDKLTPLGDPAPNASKWFAAIEMIRLGTDQDWLHKATKEISKY